MHTAFPRICLPAATMLLTAGLVLSGPAATGSEAYHDEAESFLRYDTRYQQDLAGFAGKLGITTQEAHTGAVLANHQYGAHYQGTELSPEEQAQIAALPAHPGVKKAYDAVLAFLDAVCIYDMQQWCSVYGPGTQGRAFLPF